MKMNRTEAIMQLSVIKDAKDIIYKLELAMLSDALDRVSYLNLVVQSDIWVSRRNKAYIKLMDGTRGYDVSWSEQIKIEARDLIILTII